MCSSLKYFRMIHYSVVFISFFLLSASLFNICDWRSLVRPCLLRARGGSRFAVAVRHLGRLHHKFKSRLALWIPFCEDWLGHLPNIVQISVMELLLSYLYLHLAAFLH